MVRGCWCRRRAVPTGSSRAAPADRGASFCSGRMGTRGGGILFAATFFADVFFAGMFLAGMGFLSQQPASAHATIATCIADLARFETRAAWQTCSGEACLAPAQAGDACLALRCSSRRDAAKTRA